MSNLVKKYRDIPKPVKAAMWFTMCSIIQKGISFITVPIFTRMLTVEEYGIYSIFMSWLSLITIFSTLKVYSGSYFKGLYKFKDDIHGYTSSVQILESLITILVFGIIFLFNDFFEPFLGISFAMMILMFIRVFVTPPLEFWMTEQRVKYKYHSLVAVTICIAFINPILGIIGICVSKNHHVEMRIAGAVIVYFAIGIAIYVRNIIKGKVFFNKQYWSYTLKYDIPLLPHNLSLSILGQADRIMINSMVGARQAAIYSLAYSVSMTLQIIKDAIRDAFLPWMYEMIEKKLYSEIKKVVNIILVFVSLISFLFIAFAPEVIWVMGSKDYYDAIWIIPPVASSLFFMFLYNVFSSIEFYYEKTHYAMIASIISAIMNIILNYVFIAIFGYIAAGYTTMVCYIFLSLAHYVMAKRVMLAKGERIEVVDKKFVMLYSLFIIAFAVLFSFVYEKPIIRYTLILLIFVVFIVMKNKIKFILEEMKKAKKRK